MSLKSRALKVGMAGSGASAAHKAELFCGYVNAARTIRAAIEDTDGIGWRSKVVISAGVP